MSFGNEIMMRSDQEIRHDVQEELDWDPQIGARDIAVAVRDGVVTLAGFVRSFGERMRAEADAKSVAGVVGVANDIEVRLPLFVRVADGRVTLEGEVDSHYQRARAEEVAQWTKGIRSIRNDIMVKPQILPVVIKRNIEAAFEHNAQIDADAITVETVDSGTIILKGSVRTRAERQEAERMAWSASGVRRVENRIAIVAESPQGAPSSSSWS
jgi:osmotically-inducible protein OsmY